MTRFHDKDDVKADETLAEGVKTASVKSEKDTPAKDEGDKPRKKKKKKKKAAE
jgi:hypothetical protein